MSTSTDTFAVMADKPVPTGWVLCKNGTQLQVERFNEDTPFTIYLRTESVIQGHRRSHGVAISIEQARMFAEQILTVCK